MEEFGGRWIACGRTARRCSVNADDPKDISLSPEAAGRRDIILADALRAADRRRRSLLVLRAARAACVCAVLIGTVSVVHQMTHRPTPRTPRPVVSTST